MKKYLLILIVVTGCSNSPVTTEPPTGNGFTTLLDRTGITDTVRLDSGSNTSRIIDYQLFSGSLDSVQIYFTYAGNSNPDGYLFSLRDNGTHFFKFGSTFTSNPNFLTKDTLFSLDTIRHHIYTEIGCKGSPANNIWFAVKDLKVSVK